MKNWVVKVRFWFKLLDERETFSHLVQGETKEKAKLRVINNYFNIYKDDIKDQIFAFEILRTIEID